jgi:DNA/RNA-binding domain of Phe-tRNA-synthetase-like protein
MFLPTGATVSWRSCKQTILTKSTTEAELVSLGSATNEVEWLRDLLMDLTSVEKLIQHICWGPSASEGPQKYDLNNVSGV